MTTESVQMLFILPPRSTSQACKAPMDICFKFLKNPIFCTFNISYPNIDRETKDARQMKLKQFITDLMLLFKATTSSQREALETDISKMVVV